MRTVNNIVGRVGKKSTVCTGLGMTSAVSVIGGAVIKGRTSYCGGNAPAVSFCNTTIRVCGKAPFVFGGIVTKGHSASTRANSICGTKRLTAANCGVFSDTSGVGVAPTRASVLKASISSSVLLLNGVLRDGVMRKSVVPILTLGNNPIRAIGMGGHFFKSGTVGMLPTSRLRRGLLGKSMSGAVRLQGGLVFSRQKMRHLASKASSVNTCRCKERNANVARATDITGPIGACRGNSVLCLSASVALRSIGVFSVAKSAIVLLNRIAAKRAPIGISQLCPKMCVLS